MLEEARLEELGYDGLGLCGDTLDLVHDCKQVCLRFFELGGVLRVVMPHLLVQRHCRVKVFDQLS